jgi:uncharacterized FlaG/YvyC family protein
MDVPSIGRSDAGGTAIAGQSDSAQTVNARNAFTAVRKLNNLNIADREYAVVRDPASQRFKVVVLDQNTGAVLDQFPPEDILKMLAQLSPGDPRNTGDASE